MRRLALVTSSLLLAPAIALAMDPPVIRPGECLYLYGAPPGAPAAMTEVSGSGSLVYDHCSQIPHVENERDAPHRINMWIEPRIPSPGEAEGCRVEAFVENEFSVDSAGPAWLFVSARGTWTGRVRPLNTSFNQDLPLRAWIEFQILSMSADGEGVIATRGLKEMEFPSQSDTMIDLPWSASLSVPVEAGGRFRARLVLGAHVPRRLVELDFGTSGSGRGVGYDSMSVCASAFGAGPGGVESNEIERDLYEKRCLPSLWLPQSQGGHLEMARTIVGDLADRAEASADEGANVTLARERLSRADAEIAGARYQRACRSLSDAVRGLTTP